MLSLSGRECLAHRQPPPTPWRLHPQVVFPFWFLLVLLTQLATWKVRARQQEGLPEKLWDGVGFPFLQMFTNSSFLVEAEGGCDGDAWSPAVCEPWLLSLLAVKLCVSHLG